MGLREWEGRGSSATKRRRRHWVRRRRYWEMSPEIERGAGNGWIGVAVKEPVTERTELNEGEGILVVSNIKIIYLFLDLITLFFRRQHNYIGCLSLSFSVQFFYFLYIAYEFLSLQSKIHMQTYANEYNF